MSDIAKRKESHINLSKDPDSQMSELNVFDKHALPYNALPELDLNEVSTKKQLFGVELQQPLIIASMTGGLQHSIKINENLAMAAQETGVALGVGSQRIALVDRSAGESFALVRRHAPDIFVFANFGAVQLNYGVTSSDILYLIELVSANALYLHLNPLQELLQPEGDTNFSGLLTKLEKLRKEIKVPIFIKEVGHGIGAETAKKLYDIGITNIDVAGAGGTSWAWIEAKRRESKNFENWFKNYGIPTDEAIKQINVIRPENSILVASGGLRSPIDGLKALFLGADFYSAAYPFLQSALEDTPEDLINLIKEWQTGLKYAMFLSGKSAL